MMTDLVRNGFLQAADERLRAMANDSDVFRILQAGGGDPPDRWRGAFQDVAYFVKQGGQVQQVRGDVFFEMRVPEDYFNPRTAEARATLGMRVFGLLTDLFHPNCSAPGVCLGSAFRPGSDVPELVRVAYYLVTYQLVTTDESDALNPEACRYFRAHPEACAGLAVRPLRRGGGTSGDRKSVV